MTPPLSRDLRSPCGLPAARLSGKPKQKDSENGKALKNRGLRGSKRIYRNFVAVLATTKVSWSFPFPLPSTSSPGPSGPAEGSAVASSAAALAPHAAGVQQFSFALLHP